MKILHLTPSYKPAYVYGGTTVSVPALTEALAEAGHEVEVFTTTANGTSELPVKPGSRVGLDGVNVRYFKRLSKDPLHFSPALLRAVNKHLDDFDAIHIHSWWNFPAMGAALICSLKNKPFLLSPRGILSPYSFHHKSAFFKKLLHFPARIILKKARFIASSFQEKEELEKAFNNPRVEVIPNLIRVKEAVQATDQKQGWLFLSRIHPKKNLEFLFRVLSRMKGDWKLTIGGDGDKEYLYQLKILSQSLEINQHLRWLGYVSEEQKLQLLARHELLLLPSLNENYANVVAEATSQGTGVLISDRTGAADFIQDQQLGWVLPLDEKVWAEQLQQLMEKPESLKKIQLEGAEKTKSYFSASRLIPEYEKQYFQLK